MTDWTDGYVTEIDYTYGYYAELNPLRIRLAFLCQGLFFPEVATSCELAYGQGVSVNIHAAASDIQWFGTDFNPCQAAFAQELAAAAGAGARLFDEAFADFAHRTDLPDFDFIGLHGIWSWISNENQRLIVDFVRRKLKAGGVLYISYNTLPGWAGFAPIRHLLKEHASILGNQGHGIVSRFERALDFIERMLATQPLYSRANPIVAERLKKIKDRNRHYLVHEYFNQHWYPMYFANAADWLNGAKVQYACSAHYLDHIDALHLTAEQQTFLKDIPDPMFRQTVRDFMVNQQFRRDYWVKGIRRLSALQQAELLRQQRVLLVSHRADVPLKVTGSLGEARLSEQVYAPILDVLADHKVKNLGQIEQMVKDKGIAFAQIVQAVMVLAGAGHVAPVHDEPVIAKAKKHTDKLNAHLCQLARGRGDVNFLASPVTGGGIAVDRFQQLFLLALAQGKRQPLEWAQFVWQILAAQGQKLVKGGKALDTAEENLAELTAKAQVFADKQLPILKALQIA